MRSRCPPGLPPPAADPSPSVHVQSEALRRLDVESPAAAAAGLDADADQRGLDLGGASPPGRASPSSTGSSRSADSETSSSETGSSNGDSGDLSSEHSRTASVTSAEERYEAMQPSPGQIPRGLWGASETAEVIEHPFHSAHMDDIGGSSDGSDDGSFEQLLDRYVSEAYDPVDASDVPQPAPSDAGCDAGASERVALEMGIDGWQDRVVDDLL